MEKIRALKYYNLIKNTLLFMLFMTIAGIVSISKGMDRAFDVRNYHIYNPYAFLDNRYNIDIMPADIQSYLNPLTDIPQFLLIKYFNNHPYFVTFLEGFGYAFLLFMIYKISEFIFKNFHKHWMALICTIVGGTGAVTLYGIGSLSNDLFVASLTLLSIYILFQVADKYNQYLVLISGIILGGACGFKLTNLLFGFGIFVSFCFFAKHFEKPLKTVLLFGTGLFAGFMITGGWWLIKMYILFENPVIPYFNNIFHSPIIGADHIFDADYAHLVHYTNWKKVVFLPFYLYSHVPMPGFEGPYQDFRFAVFYVAFIINLLTFKFTDRTKFKEKYGINLIPVEMVIWSAVIMYPIWVHIFKTVRYLTIYSAFSLIVFIVCLIKLFDLLPDKLKVSKDINIKNIKFEFSIYKLTITLITSILAFGLVYTTQEAFMLRRIPITNKTLDVANAKIPNNSIVFVASGSGIIVPFQNPKVRYFYLNAERLLKQGAHILSERKIKQIRRIVKNNKNRLFILIDFRFNHPYEISTELKYSANSNIDYNSCKHIRANLGNKRVESAFHICKLHYLDEE